MKTLWVISKLTFAQTLLHFFFKLPQTRNIDNLQTKLYWRFFPLQTHQRQHQQQSNLQPLFPCVQWYQQQAWVKPNQPPIRDHGNLSFQRLRETGEKSWQKVSSLQIGIKLICVSSFAVAVCRYTSSCWSDQLNHQQPWSILSAITMKWTKFANTLMSWQDLPGKWRKNKLKDHKVLKKE